MKNLPVRKPNRLKNYDYSRNSAYFITICTKNHSTIILSVTKKDIIELLNISKIILQGGLMIVITKRKIYELALHKNYSLQ